MKLNKFFQLTLMSIVVFGSVSSCKDKTETIPSESEVVTSDTPISGKINILVEESIFPIVEDVVNVFQYEYDRINIGLETKSELEILKLLELDSLRVAVLPRALSAEELESFSFRVKPKVTEFATDAIVFVVNKQFKDSIIDVDKVTVNLGSDKVDSTKDGFLVFDKYSSSIATEFRAAVGKEVFAKDYAYFLGSTNEVLKYVERNPNAIGVIGLNWLSQADSSMKSVKENLKVLAVKNKSDQQYYKPSQNNIAEGTYPLTRKLYVIDLQGKSGLGTGFASYIAGPKGQRIILKSGLVPFKVPPREILVRKEL